MGASHFLEWSKGTICQTIYSAGFEILFSSRKIKTGMHPFLIDCIGVMGKAWNSVEDGIIKKYYPKEGSRCSARIENRTRSAVKSRAILLGVSCSKAGKKWTPEEDNILRKFYSKELNKTAYRLPGRSEVVH